MDRIKVIADASDRSRSSLRLVLGRMRLLTASDPDPRVSVCTPFWPTNDDMKRDIITHEFFRLVGLADVEIINSTTDALNDANTVAQVVAYMNDRNRTKGSSGLSAPRVTYPSP